MNLVPPDDRRGMGPFPHVRGDEPVHARVKPGVDLISPRAWG